MTKPVEATKWPFVKEFVETTKWYRCGAPKCEALHVDAHRATNCPVRKRLIRDLSREVS